MCRSDMECARLSSFACLLATLHCLCSGSLCFVFGLCVPVPACVCLRVLCLCLFVGTGVPLTVCVNLLQGGYKCSVNTWLKTNLWLGNVPTSTRVLLNIQTADKTPLGWCGFQVFSHQQVGALYSPTIWCGACSRKA